MLATSFLTIAGGISAVLVGLAALVTVIERIFSPFGRWVRHWITDPVAEQVTTLSAQLENHEHYVGYHLGPNGRTTPIHERIERLETIPGEVQRLGERMAIFESHLGDDVTGHRSRHLDVEVERLDPPPTTT